MTTVEHAIRSYVPGKHNADVRTKIRRAIADGTDLRALRRTIALTSLGAARLDNLQHLIAAIHKEEGRHGTA